eukprot:SAG31_NODE_21761_length_541_cov_1.047511_2_plen_65_part_01
METAIEQETAARQDAVRENAALVSQHHQELSAAEEAHRSRESDLRDKLSELESNLREREQELMQT